MLTLTTPPVRQFMKQSEPWPTARLLKAEVKLGS